MKINNLETEMDSFYHDILRCSSAKIDKLQDSIIRINDKMYQGVLGLEKNSRLRRNGLENLNYPVVSSNPCNPQSTPLFPIFNSFEQLISNELWYNYLQTVYINTITEKSQFPIDTSSFGWYFSSNFPSTFQNQVQLVNCPKKCGDLFSGKNFAFLRSPNDWARYLYDSPCNNSSSITNGFPSHSKVEVLHGCCDDKDTGYWFYYMKGSGLYYDLGNTIVFQTKADAYEKLVPDIPYDPSTANRYVYEAAKRLHYDSIQYTNECNISVFHCEDGSYETIHDFEITDLRSVAHQTNLCPAINDNDLLNNLYVGFEGTIKFKCQDTLCNVLSYKCHSK